jgi:hypothetical protein
MSTSMIAESGHPTNQTMYFIILACLTTLGALCGGAAFAVVGSLLGLLGLLLLAALLARFNPEARRQHGFGAIAGAVARGFMLLAPFAVLAAVTRFWLHWDTAQAFAAAGLMAAGAATGGEMVKIGGGRIAGSLLPLLWSVLLSLTWMVLGGMTAALIR